MLLTSNLLNNIENNLINSSITPSGVFYVSCNIDNEGQPTTLNMTYNQIEQQILNGDLGFIQIKNAKGIKNMPIIGIHFDGRLYYIEVDNTVFTSNSSDGILTKEENNEEI